MVSATKRIYGTSFDVVVPIPCGSSGIENCLSVETARVVAEKLGIGFENVLVPAPVKKGASHPSKSSTLQPYKLSKPISGRALIIDDVASSGKHIELAWNALSGNCSHCAAMVWVSD